jgi:hypothetical protein
MWQGKMFPIENVVPNLLRVGASHAQVKPKLHKPVAKSARCLVGPSASCKFIRHEGLILNENLGKDLAFKFCFCMPNAVEVVTTIGANGLSSICRPIGIDTL